MRLQAALICLLLGLTPTHAARADTPPVHDIFIGGGTPGPFALSWSGLPAGTDAVSVNGLPQLRGLDYTLDCTDGTVTFTRPLPASAVVEVTYSPDPALSRRSGGGHTIPLSVDLLRTQHGYFSLDALGRQQADAPGSMALGVGLGWNGGQGAQLASRFVYTPAMASGGSGTPGSAASDHTGVSLAGTAGAGHWGTFSAGFTRAGLGLDAASLGSGDGGLQAGRQALTLGAALSPTKAVAAQLSFTRSDSLDSGAAPAQTASSLALTLAPGAHTTIRADIAQADAGTGGATQTVGLAVSQATGMLAVSATFRGQDLPGGSADTQDIQFKTVLTPGRAYSLETSAGQSRLGTALTAQQGVRLSFAPTAAVGIQAGLLLRRKSGGDAPDAVQTSEAMFGSTLRPFSCLEITGSYKSRLAPAADSDPNDLFDTSTARVAFAPLHTLKLTATYAQNPDDGWNLGSSADALQRLSRRGVGLETSVGALGLSGGYDWSRAYGTPDVEESVHADLGLRFSAATLLSVGFQTQTNVLDPTALPSTAYTLGFTHTLGGRLSLSVTGKRRQTTAAAAPDYNATANLGMKF